MRKKIEDGLTADQRYRLKDIKAYREKKKEYAKTEEQRKKRCEYMQKWREKNREKHNQQCKKSRDKFLSTKNGRDKKNEYARKYHAQNREKHNANALASYYRKKYGITIAERDAMILKQNGLCNICGEKKPLHMDHDHETGKLRAFICLHCNTMLGWAEHIGIKKVNQYIERYK